MASILVEQISRETEHSVHATLSCKKLQVDDTDASSADDQDEYVARPVRKKRPNRRYTEWSSDDEYRLRAFKRSFPKYKEVESSSESESDFCRPARDSVLKSAGLPIGVVRGCPSCNDCQEVRARWRPGEGCRPSVGEAPVFFPTEEEFKDTLKYIAKIRPAAEPFGICRVVPPPGWRPPCPLREDEARRQDSKFPTRIQEIHKLQVRHPVKKLMQVRHRAGTRRGRGGFRGRMGRPCRRTPNVSTNGGTQNDGVQKSTQPDESFGFEPGSLFSLGMFEKYAGKFQEQYFLDGKVAEGADTHREGMESCSKRVPSVDLIEAEYWRIVEKPTEQIEVLYGADVETGSFGSGFPKMTTGGVFVHPNSYESSGWNLNNIARLPGSMLAFEEGDISGVLVPWLYIGMCFSSFCWHVEDHHFYSLNYLHWGAPKVWYGVAGHAAHEMEAVMRNYLPELFDEQPDLLHKLVTQLSPSVLRKEGLPVSRLVQQAGEFVITFPRAYHSGFNCGFNCAEAVNVAPVDWLPHGQSAVELYRDQRRKTSVSHDKLLLAAARATVRSLLQSRNEYEVLETSECCLREEAYGVLKPNGTQVAGKQFRYAWEKYGGQDGVLVKALKARVVLERSRQTLLSGKVLMKKMDDMYDSTDERECAQCHYDLHLSAVGCECCPDRYVCLGHAQLLCDCQWGRKLVLYRYDLAQLDALVGALQECPEALKTWAEYERRDIFSSKPTSASRSIQSDSIVSTPVGNLGPCEFNCAEFSSIKIESNKVHLDSTVSSKEGHLSCKESREAGNASGKLWSSVCSETLNGRKGTGGLFVHTSEVDVKKVNHVGLKTEEYASDVGGTSNGSLKVERATEAELTSRREVIILSDDEDGHRFVKELTTSMDEFGNYDSGAQASVTGPFVGVASSKFVMENLVDMADTGSASLVRSPELRAEAPDSVSHFIPLGPRPNVSGTVTSSPSSQVQTSSSLALQPPRSRSIGSLKQQARAGNAQQRLLSNRVDHLQRIHSNSEVLKAEPSGQGWTPDIVQSSSTHTGNTLAGNPQSLGPIGAERQAGPRVAKVLRKKVFSDVELLNVGSLNLAKGWHNKYSIFPEGFRSRTSFCNVLNVLETCSYASEIVVGVAQIGPPLFKVSMEGNPSVTFVNESIDLCWQAVQEKINGDIIRRRGLGETNLPPLHPPQSLHGLEMFGLLSVNIMQAVEALDPQHFCSDYWTSKLRVAPQGASLSSPVVLDNPISPSQESHRLGPTGNGANMVNSSSPTTPSTVTTFRRPLELSSGPHSSKENVDLYGVLKGFFQRGKADELRALQKVFGCDKRSTDWRNALQALTDVLLSRPP